MRITVIPSDQYILKQEDDGSIQITKFYDDIQAMPDTTNIHALQYVDGVLSIEYLTPGVENGNLDGEEAAQFMAPFIEAFYTKRFENSKNHRKSQEDYFNSWERVRGERAYLIDTADWVIRRHRDEVDLGIDTTLSDAQYKEALRYLQALRDITESQKDKLPKNVVFPKRPKFFPEAPITHFYGDSPFNE